MESIWKGAELFLMSGDEEPLKKLHPSRRGYDDLIQPRAPMKSVWQIRRKDALVKDPNGLKEGLPASNRDPADDGSEEFRRKCLTEAQDTYELSNDDSTVTRP